MFQRITKKVWEICTEDNIKLKKKPSVKVIDSEKKQLLKHRWWQLSRFQKLKIGKWEIISKYPKLNEIFERLKMHYSTLEGMDCETD